MPDSLWPHGPQPAGLLCPWLFSGKNNGASITHSISSSRGLSQARDGTLCLLHLLHWQAGS